jgi:hypothetical protein
VTGSRYREEEDEDAVSLIILKMMNSLIQMKNVNLLIMLTRSMLDSIYFLNLVRPQ